jgi:hypothetical protein
MRLSALDELACSAVLAGPNGGSFPGPLIIADDPVCLIPFHTFNLLIFSVQDAHFQLNVDNYLTDHTMQTSTTIVSATGKHAHDCG